MLREPTPLLKSVSENHEREVPHSQYLHEIPFLVIARAVRAEVLHGVADRGMKREINPARLMPSTTDEPFPPVSRISSVADFLLHRTLRPVSMV